MCRTWAFCRAWASLGVWASKELQDARLDCSFPPPPCKFGMLTGQILTLRVLIHVYHPFFGRDHKGIGGFPTPFPLSQDDPFDSWRFNRQVGQQVVLLVFLSSHKETTPSKKTHPHGQPRPIIANTWRCPPRQVFFWLALRCRVLVCLELLCFV